jgi:uncharacterized protein
MIFEGVITTCTPDAEPHVTPMGFRRDGVHIVLRPFVPSATLANLTSHPQAVISLTDDVRVIAGCLTGRREWPLHDADVITGWRIDECLSHLELIVLERIEDAQRPTFRCEIVHETNHRPFAGFNRAQAAVVEAAILVSRLDFIDTAKLEAELTYLHIAVTKTAGKRESTAWHWLLDAISVHPRHTFKVEQLR